MEILEYILEKIFIVLRISGYLEYKKWWCGLPYTTAQNIYSATVSPTFTLLLLRMNFFESLG